MKQYDSYKDSGVEWIGKVPSHWEILRGKYMLDILSGFPFDSKKFEYDDDYMPLIRIRDINSSSTEVYYSGVYPKESVVKKGEVLIGMDGDFNVSRWNGPEALLNQRVCKLSESSKMNTCFAFYMLSLPLKLTNDVTYATTVKHLSVYDIYNTFLPVPTIAEQEGIANYLDKKCSEIDNVISAQQKRIALLQELKQSVITHAVTKGLDPNVEMKDSGVEWIDKIPSNWNIVRLKNDCSLKGRIGWNGLRSEEFEKESYAYLVTGQDFVSSDIDWSKCYQINKKRYDEDPCIQLENGDLLITKDGTIGKIAKVSNMDKPACLNSGIFVLKQKTRKEFVQGYLYWSLYSDLLKEFNSYTSTGTTILHLYQNVFENMPLVVPPKKEQQEISDYLDKKTKAIDLSLSKAQHQVELLQEYKQSLITEVVTGKRKVC